MSDDQVTFRWKDYRHGSQVRLMTLSAEEFLRRFCLHVLPKGFVRSRHFGLMANSQRSQSLEVCRKLLGMIPLVASTDIASTTAVWLCPICQAPMIVIQRLTAAEIKSRRRFTKGRAKDIRISWIGAEDTDTGLGCPGSFFNPDQYCHVLRARFGMVLP